MATRVNVVFGMLFDVINFLCFFASFLFFFISVDCITAVAVPSNLFNYKASLRKQALKSLLVEPCSILRSK